METARWYPTLETLQDGSAIVIGGCLYGGYVNEISQQVPTIEFIPSKGNSIGLNFLLNSLPANLYALTWLLPSGNLFMQATYSTSIYDWQNQVCLLVVYLICAHHVDRSSTRYQTYPMVSRHILHPEQLPCCLFDQKTTTNLHFSSAAVTTFNQINS